VRTSVSFACCAALVSLPATVLPRRNRAKLGAMCAGMFRLYWAAMQAVWEDERALAAATGGEWDFHWTDDPYLGSALPAVQVNGERVDVYYTRVIPDASDRTFEASSGLPTRRC